MMTSHLRWRCLGTDLAKPAQLAACWCGILCNGCHHIAIIVQQVCDFHLVRVSRRPSVAPGLQQSGSRMGRQACTN